MECTLPFLSSIFHLDFPSTPTFISPTYTLTALLLICLSGPMKWLALLVMQVKAWLSIPTRRESEHTLDLWEFSAILYYSSLYESKFYWITLSLNLLRLFTILYSCPFFVTLWQYIIDFFSLCVFYIVCVLLVGFPGFFGLYPLPNCYFILLYYFLNLVFYPYPPYTFAQYKFHNFCSDSQNSHIYFNFWKWEWE